MFLGAAIFLMLACVLTSAWALWAREMRTPPDPIVILAHVDLRLNPDAAGPSTESQENNLREQARSWNEALSVQTDAISVTLSC